MTDAGDEAPEPDERPEGEPLDKDSSSEPAPEDLKGFDPQDWARLADRIGTGLPTGFTESLTGANSPLVRSLESIQELTRAQVRSVVPDVGIAMAKALESYNAMWRSRMGAISASLSRFTVDLGRWSDPGFTSAIKAIQERQNAILAGLVSSLGALIESNLGRGVNRVFLPPNLRDHADEIRVSEVRAFLEAEGIALYLVPRGRTALRLLRADNRAARRRILGDSYSTIIDDCVAVLEAVSSEIVADEVNFVLDGVGAMRAGHHRSAQALFTVTLDSLIPRLHSDINTRRAITNRKKGAEVPDAIDEMNIRDAFVWLPIWNAHEEFWTKKGDKVPYYYSRHASVHGASPRQFSKRNCVQVLMLVTSLIGYADRLAQDAATEA